MEFSLNEIVEILRKRLVFITICTFTGICVFFVYSKYVIKPTYIASVQMYVNSNNSTSANLNDLNYAQKVVTTYIGFLQTKKFYEQVIDQSNLGYSGDQLKHMTNIESVNNTEIFRISVTSTSPHDSFKLVETMERVAPKLIKSIKNAAEISIVDPPVFPTSPSSPNILKNTIIGGMVAFFLSVMISLLWEVMNVNVKHYDDLLKKYQIPILGVIPDFDSDKKRKILIEKTAILKKWIKNQEDNKEIIRNDTTFMITEAYKALRTNLKFTIRHNECKKIVISSPIPEDGKSTICTNLGIVIAQTGEKVLLIDCDLRKGKLHSNLSVTSSPGVSNVISNMIDAENVIRKTSYENLYVLPLGTIPPNPSELLASIQMEKLLKKLEKEYNYIIIDTPPVNIVSDALSLFKLVDGVLIVVREGATSHPNISSCLLKCEYIDANILGFVLNGVSLFQDEKSKYHYYKYNDRNG